jgi:hypothetical protein
MRGDLPSDSLSPRVPHQQRVGMRVERGLVVASTVSIGHCLAERSLHQRAHVSYDFFATDASSSWGMGGFFGGKYFSKSWVEMAGIKQPAGYFPDLADEAGTGHVNYFELFAVFWALTMWGEHMVGCIIVLHVHGGLTLLT